MTSVQKRYSNFILTIKYPSKGNGVIVSFNIHPLGTSHNYTSVPSTFKKNVPINFRDRHQLLIRVLFNLVHSLKSPPL